MKTYLLAWNPKLWRWHDLEETSHKVKQGKKVLDRWGTGTSRKVLKGDRFFIIRLGEKPKGIFASGFVTKDSFQGLHWDKKKSASGETANYVEIQYDVLLDPESQPILERQLLNMPALSNMHWDVRMSGVQIPKDVASELEIIWAEFVKQNIS
ncbi:MAG TPA: hypothetical protein DEP19_01195 [Anaerolineae bacterium]|nr:hypothetical protein [Anaerolineae bacterium]